MQLSKEKKDYLISIGYKGKTTLEDLVKEIPTKKGKFGFSYWYDLKDSEEKKGVEFVDAVIAEVEKELKKEVKRG